ncbi:MAG: hypothetical protein D6814_13525 [Calditrichaeota bacterium]|nr:MAG: hypothetical protein D6814_13525 [Calditrichota bacterium]
MAELPHAGVVTAIQPQKRRKNRLSVHIDGKFAFGVDADIAQQFELRPDKVLGPAEIKKILGAEEVKRALERAYRFLARRARSKKEMQRRLAEYQYPPFIIEQVIEKCESLGYLDDRAFAFQYASDRLLSRPMGKRMLLRELHEKGIPEDIAEAAVEQAFAKTSEEQLVRELSNKRLPRLKNLPEPRARQKLVSFLRSRGFDWEIIQSVMLELF